MVFELVDWAGEWNVADLSTFASFALWLGVLPLWAELSGVWKFEPPLSATLHPFLIIIPHDAV